MTESPDDSNPSRPELTDSLVMIFMMLTKLLN